MKLAKPAGNNKSISDRQKQEIISKISKYIKTAAARAKQAKNMIQPLKFICRPKPKSKPINS